jgi:ADP-heptose:LPS heptosyltransferase
MISPSQIRQEPNKGKYLFHNPLLHLVLGKLDRLLEAIFKPLKNESVTITPSKILVCCQAHIGDALLGSSVLPVLKAAFPEVQIGFLIHPGSYDVFTDNKSVTWIHLTNHWKLNRQKLPLWKKLLVHSQFRQKALREIKQIGYDLAIDLYPYFPNSIPLIFAAKIPVRLGWASGGFGGLLTHALEWEQSPSNHMVDYHKRLLANVRGCDTRLSLVEPKIYSSDQIKKQWIEILKRHLIPDVYIAFHIGSGGSYRRWPTSHWKELANSLSNDGKAIVLLGNGSEEEAICREISEFINCVYNLSGKLNWRLMTEAIGKSVLLVGLESASGHIAAARNIPSVSIYSGTTKTEMWRPFHPLARVISHPVPCAPCYLSEGCEGMECVRLVATEDVLKEINSG